MKNPHFPCLAILQLRGPAAGLWSPAAGRTHTIFVFTNVKVSMYVPVSVKESLKSLGSSSRWLKMELFSQLQQLHDLSNLTLEDKTSCPPAVGSGFLRNNNPLS